MKKIVLLAGVAIGYVLGSKAGRERYEQIRSGARKVADNPTVKSATAKAQDVAATQAAAAADVAKEKVSDAASAAADKVRRESSIQAAP